MEKLVLVVILVLVYFTLARMFQIEIGAVVQGREVRAFRWAISSYESLLAGCFLIAVSYRDGHPPISILLMSVGVLIPFVVALIDPRERQKASTYNTALVVGMYSMAMGVVAMYM